MTNEEVEKWMMKIFGWLPSKETLSIRSMKFQDIPDAFGRQQENIYPDVPDKINLFDGSIPVLNFDQFLNAETPGKWVK